jgi:hypothetical protein
MMEKKRVFITRYLKLELIVVNEIMKKNIRYKSDPTYPEK